MSMQSLFSVATPAVAIRGVHLDLKGLPPTPRRLLELLDVFAACRYNAVLVEWEDTFPWTVDLAFRCETAYTPEQVRQFSSRARELGIELIPLVQCLGHMETPLSVPGYAHLRELPHRSDCLNPLAPGARELVTAMVQDVLSLMPDVKRFHLGGDEAWSFGQHPDTAAYVQRHGKGALYLHHVEPILDMLGARGVRPILWHDMMRDWEAPALANLRQKADLCVWGYHGRPGGASEHDGAKVFERFVEHGLRLWGATAYKGAEGEDADLPNIDRRQENALGWANIAGRYNLAGVFATAWSRYSTHRVQNEPIDAALDSLLTVAVALHDGRPPEGGVEACVAGLDEIGEAERFRACKSAMAQLTRARQAGWRAVTAARQHIVCATLDARRRSGGAEVGPLERLRDILRDADAAAAATRSAFAGLIDPIWIDRYLAERIEPLREEYFSLLPRARQLNPAGYEATLA